MNRLLDDHVPHLYKRFGVWHCETKHGGGHAMDRLHAWCAWKTDVRFRVQRACH